MRFHWMWLGLALGWGVARAGAAEALPAPSAEQLAWQRLEVIGQKQLRRFPAVTASRVRLIVERAVAPAAVAEFGLHFDPVSAKAGGTRAPAVGGR
jgi:hypothetical protein